MELIEKASEALKILTRCREPHVILEKGEKVIHSGTFNPNSKKKAEYKDIWVSKEGSGTVNVYKQVAINRSVFESTDYFMTTLMVKRDLNLSVISCRFDSVLKKIVFDISVDEWHREVLPKMAEIYGVDGFVNNSNIDFPEIVIADYLKKLKVIQSEKLQLKS